MRKWFIVLALALVVLVGAGALAVANLESFVNANREAVAERVESVVGRKVSFGEVGVAWAGGFAVRVADLRVGEDPALAKDAEEDFLAAEAVDVRVSLLSALFGRIEVTRVIVRSPRITVIQTARGLSTDSLGGAPSQPGEAGGASRELQVSLVDVRDGELRFIDHAVKPPATFEVKALDVRIPSYRASEPVELEISAALAGAKSQNLALSGTVGPLDADSPRADLSLRLDPLEIGELVRLSLLPADLGGSGTVSVEAEAEGTLDALTFTANVDARRAALRYGDAFDKPADVALDLELSGSRKGDAVAIERARLRLDETEVRGTATLANLEKPKLDFTASSSAVAPQDFGAGDPGDVLRDIDAKGSFAFPSSGMRGKATVRSPEGVYSKARYRNLKLDLAMAGGRVTIESLTANAFQGKLSSRGTYDLERSAFDVDTEVSQIRIEELLATRSKAAASLLSGTLSGNLDLRGAGSGWEEIKRVLDGDGEVRIADGVLEKFNPAQRIFAALALLPNFRGGGLARFIDAHPKVFGAEAAPFQAMTGRLQIREGWVQLRDFVLGAEDYDLLGKGRYSLDGELDLKTLMAISEALSEELVAVEPTLRYLRDATGRVELPVALRGAPPKVAVVPDVSRIAKSAGRELLTDALTDALGGGRPAEEAAEPEPAAPAEEGASSTPEAVGQELLRQGLEGLLRGGSEK
jgi:uncharacterized protein involved in outer membrane biogenesis